MRIVLFLLSIFVCVLPIFSSVSEGIGDKTLESTVMPVPILLYHRFGPVAADSMTVTTSVFESHLKYLREHDYSVIPLRQLVNYYLKKAPQPPQKSLAIVIDDGHESIYTDMLPLIKKYNIPVTIFIYPSAISNASYAMTWAQLRELKETGLIDFQSHTYWHPNFKTDRKRMNIEEYEKSVEIQLKKSKETLDKKLGINVDMLAWPFGIYDAELIHKAAESGYVAAFTIERRHVTQSDNIMALPRYLMANTDKGKAFERILNGNSH